MRRVNCVVAKACKFIIDGKPYRKGDPVVVDESFYERWSHYLQMIEYVPSDDVEAEEEPPQEEDTDEEEDQ